MTGKRSRLFHGTGWFAICLVTSAVISFADTTNRSPAIFPNGEGTNTSAYRLVWPTDPGVRYQPQQSSDLLGWTSLDGYPKLAPGLAVTRGFPHPRGDGLTHHGHIGLHSRDRSEKNVLA